MSVDFHPWVPKSSKRNLPLKFQDGKHDSRVHLRVRASDGISDGSSVSSLSTCATLRDASREAGSWIRSALAQRPVSIRGNSLGLSELPSWEGFAQVELDCVADFVLSFVQISCDGHSRTSCPIHVPRLLSFFGALAKRRPYLADMYEFTKWYFPAVFSLFRRQPLPPLFGSSVSQTFLRRCLPFGCGHLTHMARIYSYDLSVEETMGRLPRLIPDVRAFGQWRTVLNSLLYAKGAFPMMPKQIVTEKTRKGAEAFTVPQPDMEPGFAKLVAQEAYEIVGQVALKNIERRYTRRCERELELLLEPLDFSEAILTDLWWEHLQRDRYVPEWIDGELTDVARRRGRVLESYRRMRIWNLASQLGSWATCQLLLEEFPLDVDMDLRAGSFGACLGGKRKDGGQFGAINHHFRREHPRTVVGWSVTSDRDPAYEEYLMEDTINFTSDVDRRCWDEEVYEDGRAVYAYPILAHTPATLQEDFSALLDSACSRHPSCVFLGIAEPMKVRNVAVADPDVYFLASHLQPLLYDFVSRHPTFRLTSRPVSLDLVKHVMSLDAGASHFLSGDYAGATNDLHQGVTRPLFEALSQVLGLNDQWKQVLENTLFNHQIMRMGDDDNEDEPDVVELGPQQRGQFMGSPVSFPVLCLANAVACRLSGLGDFLHRSPILINGDDVLIRCDPAYYANWQRVTAACGLVPSIGKCYFSTSFMTINSVLYERWDDHLWRQAPIWRWSSLRPYPDDVNLRDVLGSDDVVDAGIAGLCRALYQSYQGLGPDEEPDRCYRCEQFFWIIHRNLIGRLWEEGFITHPALPRTLFGLGLPLYFWRGVHGGKLSISVNSVKRGIWSRDHASCVGQNTLAVLPRLPKVTRTRCGEKKDHCLRPSAGLVNLFTWTDVVRTRPSTSWTIRKLLRRAKSSSKPVRLGSDNLSRWESFCCDLCSDPYGLSYKRSDLFSSIKLSSCRPIPGLYGC